MVIDNERKEEKRVELVHDIEESIERYTPHPREISNIIMENFCSIEPPETDTRPGRTRGISFKKDTTGTIISAKSVKPGNIRLNWKKLLISGAESTFPTVACVSNPILIPLAAIIIWNKIWTNLHIDFDQKHAVVLWTMWHNCDSNQKIKKEILLDLVNKECQKYNLQGIYENELFNICNDLARVKCVENTNENQMWSLVETADVSYS